MSLFGRKGDTAVENGLADIMEEGETGMNGESGINTYTLSGVRRIAGEKLLCSTGSPACCSVMTQRDGMRERRETREGGDVCIIMNDLSCCIAETNTTL